MTEPGLGHVMFGGDRFPVTGVRLSGGAVNIMWEVEGPYPGGTWPVTIFGEDGQGIGQAGETRVPQLPGNAVIALTNVWVIGTVTEP